MDVMRTVRLSMGRLTTPTPEGPAESFPYAMDCLWMNRYGMTSSL